MRFLLSLILVGCAAGLARADEWSGFQPIGAVAEARLDGPVLRLACADGAEIDVTVLAADVVRVRTRFAGQVWPALDHSWAIAEDVLLTPADWNFAVSPTQVTLRTARLVVEIQRDPVLVSFRDAATGAVINRDQRPMARNLATGEVAAAKALGLDEHFYGLGEKAARLDRRRARFEMWTSDTPGYVEGTDPIYQSIPFYVGWQDGASYGLFYDNSHRTHFDFGRLQQEYASYRAEAGVLDYTFFLGPDMKTVVGNYTALTGRMPMPPLWALGHQQSRYSYYPASMVLDIAKTYRARDLPLDVLHLDIHYMDGFRVFTWDPQHFADPAAMDRELEAMGVKTITIVDPGVKIDPGYPVYDEGVARDFFLKRTNGKLYEAAVWPGPSVFVDYTKADARAWWGNLHHTLLDVGVDGIWTDMNEPSDFVDKTGETQTDVVFDDLGQRTLYGENRNTFALNMARATREGLLKLRPDERPFVITRAGYAGIQRYAVVWTGDNNATFESLALNVPMFASLGLSGEAFVGADIPGFIGRGDGELLARAYQVGFLAPFLRNHGAIDMYDHEPWRYGKPYEDIVRKYLKLRYALMPYLYTTIEEAHRTGVPWFRPLLLEFQNDESTLNLDDQFMVGAGLMAAPVLQRGARAREVYFPAGRWYDFWSGEEASAESALRAVDAPLDHLPLYVRGGTILPATESMNHTGERPWSPLRWSIYPDAEGRAHGELYEDDGHSFAFRAGASRRTIVDYASWGTGGAEIKITVPRSGFAPAERAWEFVLPAPPAEMATVTINGVVLPRLQTDETGPGWRRASDGRVVLRVADTGAAQTLLLLP